MIRNLDYWISLGLVIAIALILVVLAISHGRAADLKVPAFLKPTPCMVFDRRHEPTLIPGGTRQVFPDTTCKSGFRWSMPADAKH